MKQGSTIFEWISIDPYAIKRKVAAAGVILEEIEGLGWACFEQGRLSEEKYEYLKGFVPKQRALLQKYYKKRRVRFLSDSEREPPPYLKVCEESDTETGIEWDINEKGLHGVFIDACQIYALLWDEVNGKNRDAWRGWKNLQGARDGHAKVHGTPEEKQARWTAYQAAFDDARANNPHRPKEWCYTKLAEQFGVCIKTIKRHTSPK